MRTDMLDIPLGCVSAHPRHISQLTHRSLSGRLWGWQPPITHSREEILDASLSRFLPQSKQEQWNRTKKWQQACQATSPSSLSAFKKNSTSAATVKYMLKSFCKNTRKGSGSPVSSETCSAFEPTLIVVSLPLFFPKDPEKRSSSLVKRQLPADPASRL